jgi:hypothetical protein
MAFDVHVKASGFENCFGVIGKIDQFQIEGFIRASADALPHVFFTQT